MRTSADLPGASGRPDPPLGELLNPCPAGGWRLNRDTYWLLGEAQATEEKPGIRRKDNAVLQLHDPMQVTLGLREHPFSPGSDGANNPHGAGLPPGPAMTQDNGHGETRAAALTGPGNLGQRSAPSQLLKPQVKPLPPPPGLTPSPQRSRGEDRERASPGLASLVLMDYTAPRPCYFHSAPHLADLMFQPIYSGLWQDSHFSKANGMVLF